MPAFHHTDTSNIGFVSTTVLLNTSFSKMSLNWPPQNRTYKFFSGLRMSF